MSICTVCFGSCCPHQSWGDRVQQLGRAQEQWWHWMLTVLLPCTREGTLHGEGRDITNPSGPRFQMFPGEEGSCRTKVLL